MKTELLDEKVYEELVNFTLTKSSSEFIKKFTEENKEYKDAQRYGLQILYDKKNLHRIKDNVNALLFSSLKIHGSNIKIHEPNKKYKFHVSNKNLRHLMLYTVANQKKDIIFFGHGNGGTLVETLLTEYLFIKFNVESKILDVNDVFNEFINALDTNNGIYDKEKILQFYKKELYCFVHKPKLLN